MSNGEYLFQMQKGMIIYMVIRLQKKVLLSALIIIALDSMAYGA